MTNSQQHQVVLRIATSYARFGFKLLVVQRRTLQRFEGNWLGRGLFTRALRNARTLPAWPRVVGQDILASLDSSDTG
jgi:hypothetical protein